MSDKKIAYDYKDIYNIAYDYAAENYPEALQITYEDIVWEDENTNDNK